MPVKRIREILKLVSGTTAGKPLELAALATVRRAMAIKAAGCRKPIARELVAAGVGKADCPGERLS